MRHPIRNLFATLAVLALFALLGGGIQAQDEAETSKSFSFATYLEEDPRTTVLVSTLTGAVFENEPYVPLQIAIGLRRKGPALKITPESFELVDRDGRRYPLASYEEVKAQGNLLERVDRVRNQNPIVVGNRFANLVPVRFDFFPPPGQSIRIRIVEIPRDHFIAGLLYFPFPDGGLEGVLTLRFQAEGLPEPIDTRISVPLER